MKIREWFRSNPVLGSLAATAAAFVLLNGTGLFCKMLPDTMAVRYFCQITNFLLPMVLAVVLGYGWVYRRGHFGRTMAAGTYNLVVYSFLLLLTMGATVLTTEVQWKTPAGVILGVIALIGIGIREETVFRGIISNNLGIAFGKDARGVWKAVILDGLLFGLIHMSNLFAGVHLPNVLVQVAVAVAAGMFMTAVYFRGGNLWALMLMHTLIDSSGLFQSSFTTMSTAVDDINKLHMGSLLLIPVYVGLTAFLLRKAKMESVLMNLQEAAALDGTPSGNSEPPEKEPEMKMAA